MVSRFPMFISLGEMIGGFVISIFSDIIGRKSIILYGGLLWLIIRIITIFVDHYYLGLLTLFINGFL